MDNAKRYRHLSPEERAMLQLDAGRTSLRGIARLLGRSHSTLSRELKRNGVGQAVVEAVTERPATPLSAPLYQAAAAGRRYAQARLASRPRCKLVAGSGLYTVVRDQLLYRRWSPQQIASKLREAHPDDPGQRVSHETIYASIYAHPRGALKEELIAQLRQRKSQRGRRRRTLAGGPVQAREDQRIEHRPAEVGSRELPGHWEGDFIKGAYNRSGIGTLVERTTRFVVLCKMDGCTADAALAGFTRQMKRLPAFLRESLTYDRGSEMACHEELAKRLNIDIWFADPHAPWQRGTNENTNGLLRQFLPKGTDLSVYSQTQLNDIARLLNGRPRETLGWRSPEEAMAVEMAKFGRAHREGAALPGGPSSGAVLKVWRPAAQTPAEQAERAVGGPLKGPLRAQPTTDVTKET